VGSGRAGTVDLRSHSHGCSHPGGRAPFEGAVNGGPADGEDFHKVGDGVIAGGVHAGELGLLAGGELGLLAAQLAFGAGDGHAFAGAEPEQVDFEFGEGGQDVEEQLAERSAGS
jgi:hypothetical protein